MNALVVSFRRMGDFHSPIAATAFARCTIALDRSGTERVIPILLAMVERVAAEHELHVFALRQESDPATWPLLGATVHNAGTRRPSLRAWRGAPGEERSCRGSRTGC